jgi:hypothetical protein
MDLFVAESRSFFRDHMPMLSATDFFERLCQDPDVQIPAIFASPGGRLAASVEYRVSCELREAVRRAAPGRTSTPGTAIEIGGDRQRNPFPALTDNHPSSRAGSRGPRRP